MTSPSPLAYSPHVPDSTPFTGTTCSESDTNLTLQDLTVCQETQTLTRGSELLGG